MAGFVYLAGAGPGDPKLLTLRPLELMRSAEVAAYDELISPEILPMISAKTGMFATSGACKHTAPRRADSACAKPAVDAHDHDDSLNNHDSL